MAQLVFGLVGLAFVSRSGSAAVRVFGRKLATARGSKMAERVRSRIVRILCDE